LKVIFGDETAFIDFEPPKGLKGLSMLLKGLNSLREWVSLSGFIAARILQVEKL
jgi:hypothetical protein